MEINKQLFEDVLSGKLKGTFVLKNGSQFNDNLLTDIYNATVVVGKTTYYFNGKPIVSDYNGILDIVDFIPDMKENELTIEIPDGKIVDWDESKKQNKIVLKDKQLTYEDVCKKLFKDDHFTIAWEGYPIKCCSAIYNASNATTEHQLECILAKNKLANVAVYLNDGWKPTYTIAGHFDAWVLFKTPIMDYIGCVKIVDCAQNSNVLFKSFELAQQAIEILGEETIKLALEPLGI